VASAQRMAVRITVTSFRWRKTFKYSGFIVGVADVLYLSVHRDKRMLTETLLYMRDIVSVC